MTTIGNIWTAMYKGKEIANPETWKDKQNTASLLTAMLGALVFLLRFSGLIEFEINSEDLVAIGAGLATVLGVCNKIITTISSAKVGFKGGVK